jgi:hypothetical protein
VDQRRYRKLYVRIWRHPVFRALSDAHKTVALYLLTGPQTNRIGCYVLSPAMAAEDLNVPLPAFLKRLGVVCEVFGWEWDRDARVLWVPSWWKWNRPDNPKVLQGALGDQHEVPPCQLMVKCLETVSATFPKWYPKPLPERTPNQEQEQEQEKDQEQKQEPSARLLGPVGLAPSATDPDANDRAAAFIEDYTRRYLTHRGSPYRRRDALEFPDACQLVGMWPNPAHLGAMVDVFLTCSHKFAREGSRSIRQFAALANWCDEQVRGVGASGEDLTTEAILARMGAKEKR